MRPHSLSGGTPRPSRDRAQPLAARGLRPWEVGVALDERLAQGLTHLGLLGDQQVRLVAVAQADAAHADDLSADRDRADDRAVPRVEGGELTDLERLAGALGER